MWKWFRFHKPLFHCNNSTEGRWPTSEVKGFDMRATALGISLYCGCSENFKETSIHINIFYAQIKDKVIKVNFTIWYCQWFLLYSEAYNRKSIFFIWLAFLPLISLFLIPLSLLLNTSATRFFVSSAFLFLQRWQSLQSTLPHLLKKQLMKFLSFGLRQHVNNFHSHFLQP